MPFPMQAVLLERERCQLRHRQGVSCFTPITFANLEAQAVLDRGSLVTCTQKLPFLATMYRRRFRSRKKRATTSCSTPSIFSWNPLLDLGRHEASTSDGSASDSCEISEARYGRLPNVEASIIDLLQDRVLDGHRLRGTTILFY